MTDPSSVIAGPAQLISDALVYAESPRWYDNALYVSDVHDYKVKKVSLDGRVDVVVEVPKRPGGIGILPDGSLLVASAFDRRISRVVEGKLAPVAELAALTTGLLNDMVVGPRGSAYVGATGYNMMAGESPRPGQVVLIAQNGEARVVADDVQFPNGICLDEGESHLYLAETSGRRVSRFDVLDNGSLGPRRTWAELPAGPDGMCLDADGGAWVALLTEGKFLHLNAGGEIDEELKADGALAVACVTIGADRSELVVSSAHTTMPELANGRSSAVLHRLPIRVAGSGTP